MKKYFFVYLFLLFSFCHSWSLSNIDYENLILSTNIETSAKAFQDFHKVLSDGTKLTIKFDTKYYYINFNNDEDRMGRTLSDRQEITALYSLDNNNFNELFKLITGKTTAYNTIIQVCNRTNQESILVLMMQFGNQSITAPTYISFQPYVFIIKNKKLIQKEEIAKAYFDDGFNMINDLTNPPTQYKYADQQSILMRLQDVGECIQEQNDLEAIMQDLKIKIDLGRYDQIHTRYSSSFIKILTKNVPLTVKNIEKYNNIAYYLEQAGAYEEAIYLLEKIIQQFPDRTVAYLNLGDAYWGNQQKDKAIIAYQEYQKQMQKLDKASRIPKVILERLSWHEKHNN